jgi:hypothetical protein
MEHSDETLALLAFGKGGNADGHLGRGWSAGEAGFRWMIDDVSELWLGYSGPGPYVLTIDLHPLTRPPSLLAQRVVVEVGGTEVYRASLTVPVTCDIDIPAAVMASGGRLRVMIRHPDAISPSELAGIDDQRKLALAVREARLRRALSSPHAASALVTDNSLSTLSAPAVIGRAKRPSTVFVGNCQMNALSTLYRYMLGGSDHDVMYVPSYSDATDDSQRAVADATVLVQQVLDFAPRIGDLPTRAKVHLVPHITAAFLWPYTGTAHPLNRPEPIIEQTGPYNAELGDTFLNRMIATGTSPDDAVEQYLAADVPALRRIDRLQELVFDRQRDRDANCDFRIADHIAAQFRITQLFRSPNHPTMRLALWFATEVFSRMGANGAAISHLTTDAPNVFPTTETPIHPTVASHFGLTYAPPERRYQYFNEGDFTFEEYAHRYMRYEWSASLAEAMDLLRRRQTAVGAAKLEGVLPDVPRSAVARMALADALATLGRLPEAVEYACQAVELQPDNARFVERLRQISEHSRHHQSASVVANSSVV